MDYRRLNSVVAYVAYKKADSRRPSIDLLGRVKDSTKELDKSVSSGSKATKDDQASPEGKRKKGRKAKRPSMDLPGRVKDSTKKLDISVNSGSQATKEDQTLAKKYVEKTAEK